MTNDKPAVWTRGELKSQRGMTDAQVDDFLAEMQRAAASVGMASPIQAVGEGDSQLLTIDADFYRLGVEVGFLKPRQD